MITKPDKQVMADFNIEGVPFVLPGGEGRTFRVNGFVLKHINKDARDCTNWISDLFCGIKENNFRVPRPVLTKDGHWITKGGWTAWTFLEGNHEYKNYIKESVQAITAFHQAISDVPKPLFINSENSPYSRADRHAWGEKPKRIDPLLKDKVEMLYKLRRPIKELQDQLIHGDLNPENILFTPNLPPAIIDIALYWRPLEFALAVYAYWIGPWRNDLLVLKNFISIKEFDQMLVRAAIRMLLIMSEFKWVKELDKYLTATAIVEKWVNRK